MHNQPIGRQFHSEIVVTPNEIIDSVSTHDEHSSLIPSENHLGSLELSNSAKQIWISGEFKPIESFLLELTEQQLSEVLQQAIKHQETISPFEQGERSLAAFMEKYFASFSEVLPAEGIETLICDQLRLSRFVLADTCEQYGITQRVIEDNNASKGNLGLSTDASLVEMRIEQKLRDNLFDWKEEIVSFKNSVERNIHLVFRDGWETQEQALIGSPENAFGKYHFNLESLRQVASYLVPVIGWSRALIDYTEGALEILKPVESSVRSPALKELLQHAQSLELELKLVPIKKDGLYSVTMSCARL